MQVVSGLRVPVHVLRLFPVRWRPEGAVSAASSRPMQLGDGYATSGRTELTTSANAQTTAGCLTDDDSCGCAWSKCQPYHSLPCHNARKSYECKPYDVSEHMQRCGY